MAGKGADNQGKGNKTIMGRGRPREHPKGTSDHVTSRGSATGDVRSDIAQLPVSHARTLPRNPFGWLWWRHFRCKGPTMADIAQLPVTHAHLPVTHAHTLSRWPPSVSRELRSLSVAMLLVLLYYCTTTIVRKKRGKPKKIRENSTGKIREKSTLYMYILYIHCFSELRRIILE